MSLTYEVVSIGFDKNGEADFALTVARLEGLSPEKMEQLRSMLCVAIGQIEQHWFTAKMRKPESQAARLAL